MSLQHSSLQAVGVLCKEARSGNNMGSGQNEGGTQHIECQSVWQLSCEMPLEWMCQPRTTQEESEYIVTRSHHKLSMLVVTHLNCRLGTVTQYTPGLAEVYLNAPWHEGNMASTITGVRFITP